MTAASGDWQPAASMDDFLPMAKPSAVLDVVHHDIAVLRSLGRVLSVYGYRPCMFTSAEQYRRSVEEGEAFCVVIDIGLRSVFSGLARAGPSRHPGGRSRSSSSARQMRPYRSRLW